MVLVEHWSVWGIICLDRFPTNKLHSNHNTNSGQQHAQIWEARALLFTNIQVTYQNWRQKSLRRGTFGATKGEHARTHCSSLKNDSFDLTKLKKLTLEIYREWQEEKKNLPHWGAPLKYSYLIYPRQTPSLLSGSGVANWLADSKPYGSSIRHRTLTQLGVEIAISRSHGPYSWCRVAQLQQRQVLNFVASANF
jgi:hypothetical protein